MLADPREDEVARAAFKSALQPLLTAHNRKFDVAQWTVFYEALRDIPTPLLQRAAFAMAGRPRRFPVEPGDIRAAAEECRQQLLKLHPYERCVECRDSGGFVETVDGAGVTRLARCGCFAEYRRRVEAMGATDRPVLQLAAGEEERAS